MNYLWNGGQKVTLPFGSLVHKGPVTLSRRKRKR